MTQMNLLFALVEKAHHLFRHAEFISASQSLGILPCDGVEILKRVQDDRDLRF